MSLNTAHANGGVLIFNGEMILLYCDGVEFVIEGNDARDFAGSKKGRIYLTTHRMIFVNKSEKDPLQSFSFPFFTMTKINLEQPIFGANYIKGIVNAQVGGNWTGQAEFKLKFFRGGAIEFGQAMLHAAKMANRYMPPQPPPYMPHAGPYYPAPPPAYMPPSGGAYGFVPTDVFPDAPPANSVYTSDMPPPYPGIHPPAYGAQQPAYGAAGYSGAPPPPGFNGGVASNQPSAPDPMGPPPQYTSEGTQRQPAYNPNAPPTKTYVHSFYQGTDPNSYFMPAPNGMQNGYQQSPNFEPPPPYEDKKAK